ncbi:MAG: putative DNA binding domain-containing protein [Pirellulaceae bacterium]|nr:putative DNA binding domain-containing protein [Pirellulaceae bacterium]
MIDESSFRELVRRAEGPTLDFKRDYDFSAKDARNDFIKDVISMANTPRGSAAHIVVGVSWTPELGAQLHGVRKQFDDAELIDALGVDRVQPVPTISYTPLRIDGHDVGVIEIPVQRNGPYTALKDFGDHLRQGAVYFRSGTKNTVATGPKLHEIFSWFQSASGSTAGPETNSDSWEYFLENTHDFEVGRRYVLVTDRVGGDAAATLSGLGLPPWSAVIDFDPGSETDGVLSKIGSAIRQTRTLHMVVKGERPQIHPERGTHWFFARGLAGRSSTLVQPEHKQWLRTYKRELSEQLARLQHAFSPTPVCFVLVWQDSSMLRHMRTLFEEVEGHFGDSAEIVVVTEEPGAFASLCEENDATLVSISVRNLCSGLIDRFGHPTRAQGSRCAIPTKSGAPHSLEPRDLLWITEDLEIIHLDIGLDGDSNADAFRRGAEITWRNLDLRHDCDRDITDKVRRQVERDLEERHSGRINLYHHPGAGGTTVARRIAWDLHRKYPCVVLRSCEPRFTAERLAKIAALTENSVLLLIDGGKHLEGEIDELYEFVRGSQTPVVMLQVLRRHRKQETGSRQAWLKQSLSPAESGRFEDAYTSIRPECRDALSAVLAGDDPHLKTPFYCGLVAFEQHFDGLARYVHVRLDGLSEPQKTILGFLSFAQYYAQCALDRQLFANFLGVPRSRRIDFRAVFESRPDALDLVIETDEGKCRTLHYLIAGEILQQTMWPAAGERQKLWRQKLADFAVSFAQFLQQAEHEPGDQVLDLIQRLYIFRDNSELLGTERAARRQYSQLIEEIPSRHGQLHVLQALVELFPEESHFHAHLGRFLGQQDRYDEAHASLSTAIELAPKDNVLHHVQGMVHRYEMNHLIDRRMPLENVLNSARAAQSSFQRARRLDDQDEHGYISEVQTIIRAVDYAARCAKKSAQEVVSDRQADSFIREAFDTIETLLDQVRTLRVGESLSPYEQDCRAKLNRMYGQHSAALEAWNNLLDRRDVVKPPVRRQIVWTLLNRQSGDWKSLTPKEVTRCVALLEDNLDEVPNDATSLRLWLRAVRHSQIPPGLHRIIEKVSYWKANTASLEAAFYLYVLHSIDALDGTDQALADAERALDECRSLARYRRDRSLTFEWMGPGTGISRLVHQSQLGDWADGFWANSATLVRLDGRIAAIDAPQKGRIELENGLSAFFVPTVGGFHKGRDENVAVTCFVGFSYDGVRAWEVQPRP